MLEYTQDGTSIVPLDGGPISIGGAQVPHSGMYVAKVSAAGMGVWAFGHDILQESTWGNMARDGGYLFFDHLGPEFVGDPAGPDGNLIRLPLAGG